MNGKFLLDTNIIVEDLQAIVQLMPRPYRGKYGTHTFFDPFPPPNQRPKASNPQ